MSNHDSTRRSFLVRAAVGAGAVAGSGLVPDAYTQTLDEHKNEAAAPSQSHSISVQHGAFFNYDQATTIAAFTERLMPGAPGKPGAHEAGVLNYIDMALAGAYADLQDFYRRGLAQLDAYSRTTYKKPFVQLEATQQDEVITGLEQGKASGFSWPTSAGVLQRRSDAHHGRHVRGPPLWWKPRLFGLAPGRASPALKAISHRWICRTNKSSRARP